MILGLRTAIYHVDDLPKAKEWHAKVLGKEPYFDEPFYVGFNVGGYELGLNPDTSKVTKVTGGGGCYTYWGVRDARAEYQRLLELGAEPHEEVQDVGGGILVATVLDAWGNVFGIIENPQFKIDDSE